MKKFITNLAIFLVLVGSIYFAVSEILDRFMGKSSYIMAAMIEKHARLDSIDSPRIILVGGSNLAFGMDSRAIEDAFDIPVVNLGLHAGLGVDFMLNEAEGAIGRGDIVLLSFEHFLDTEGSYGLKRHVSFLYPPAGNFFRMNLREDLLIHTERTKERLGFFFNGVPANDTPLMYRRESFNKYGDGVGHLGASPPKNRFTSIGCTYVHWDGIELINAFNEKAKNKGASVFYIHPPYPESGFTEFQEPIKKLSEDLSNELQIEVLNDPKSMALPDSLFFDTVYHLTGTGRDVRTNYVIHSIKSSTDAMAAIETARDLIRSRK